MSDPVLKAGRGMVPDAAASREISPPVGGAFGNAEAIFRQIAAALDTGPLIEAIKGAGYKPAGEVESNGVKIAKYHNPKDDTVILLSDSNSLPGREASQGGACVTIHENRIVAGTLIPTPSEKTFLAEFGAALGSRGALEKFTADLEFRGVRAQFEALNHEFVHIGQVQNETPWGKALLSNQLHRVLAQYRELGFEVPVSSSLAGKYSEALPRQEEVQAASLVSEIAAHMVNETTTPDRCAAAKKVGVYIHTQLTEGAPETKAAAITRALEFWQGYIGQFPCYSVGGSEAVKIATGWLLTHGKLE